MKLTQKIMGTDTDTAGAGAKAAIDKPIVVRIKPGTAAEKSLKFVLPAEMADKPIDEVIRYGLKLGGDDGITREGQRYQERITGEMKDKYGISVNSTSLRGTEPLRDYLTQDTTTGGVAYLEAEIIVAAKQEGASVLEQMLR